MGGGDLNMKKSWHPVLLVNQERVWKAEKSANEEKKKLAQLRKEQEEERQMAELQKLQEQATGKKRVERLDFLYSQPGAEGGALGGQRLGEREMEDYLLGKKRVDDVLAAGEKNVGALHKEFIAVQNANTARDTASKIREDPLLAIKKQELAQMEALRNRPDIRKQLKAMQNGSQGGSKEERRAKRKSEKEERRRDRAERRERRHRDRDSRSPASSYSDDRDRYGDRDRRRRRDSYDDGRGDEKRHRSRSYSPARNGDRDRRGNGRDDRSGDGRVRVERRDSGARSRDSKDRDRSRERSRRDDSPRRYRDEEDRKRSRDEGRDAQDHRIPPPRHYPNGNGANGHHHSNAHGGRASEDVKPDISHSNRFRPSAMDLTDRPSYSSSNSRPPPAANNPNAKALEEQRAARLAAMAASASDLDVQRTKSLAQRAEEERREAEKDERLRKKYGKEDVKGVFFGQKSDMGLSEALSRRGGQGLQRDI